MANMSYQQGRRIRNTGLKELITQNIVSGQGVGKAIRSSISQSFKAKMTGIKEKFDPLNIAKALTGNLGAAVLGRVTGRSDKDIQYFSGGRRGNYAGNVTQDSDLSAIQPALYTKVAEGQNQRMKKGEGVASVLGKLYNLMKLNYTEEEKRRELDINFKYKQEQQKEKWHKELLEAITGIKGTGSATKVTKPKSGGLLGGLGDMFKKIEEMIEKAITDLKTLLEPLLDFAKTIGKNLLGRLGSLLMNPYVLAFLGVAAAAGLAVYLAALMSDELTKLIKQNIPNMNAKTPQEAAAVLENGKPEDIAFYDQKDKNGKVIKSGKDYLTDIIKNSKARAQELLKDPEANKQAIIDMGGLKMVKQIAEGPDVAVPKVTDTQLRRQPPRPEAGDPKHKNVTQKDIDAGSPAGNKLKLEQEGWDQKYGEKYNTDGTPKETKAAKPLISGVEESTAGAGRGMAQLEDYNAQTEPAGASFDVKPNGIPSASPASTSTGAPAASASPASESTGSPSASASPSAPTASMAPPTPNPIGERAQNATAENTDLQMKESQPKIINIDNSKNITSKGGSKGSDIVFDTSIPVRTDDSTLQKVQKQNLRMV
jgi:hypothetical protein